ncbi:MAG: SDR family oxidoreductase [Rhodospirillaceae bacterium]|nr:SDR family oxidoreductase [Rhodospirillaceae bacterium]MDD9917628.1 SDR family oxidoreductase [Rhodospirillaceae bacterium]MDD9926795.1 SDR family oxidoreductase [Rhodospirillaceae bacterium]
MAGDLAGKRALVTGAGRGIGRAIAQHLAEQGVAVAVAARTASDVEDVVASLQAESSPHAAIALDLATEEGPTQLVKALSKFGAPEIVVHNLGGTCDVNDPFAPIEEWRKVMRLNFDVAVELNRSLVPAMRDAKWGRVVNIASVAAVELNGPPSYAAAKAALCAYTRCVGRLLGADGVIMSAVLPGVVETEGGYWEQQRSDDPARVQKYLDERCPLGRFGTPEEVASFVGFLCSDNASFNPGGVFPLDGGQLRGYAF